MVGIMGAKKNPLHSLDTYVFIDVSNIRLACYKTLGFKIDFARLLDYFKQKYPNLKDVRYYEGIAKGDAWKQRMFNYLAQRGYTICSLERKSYNAVEKEEREIKCPKCGNEWVAEFARERKAMKSNVDVYLATELLNVAITAAKPIHVILVSCDGDYAEMIESALNNPNVSISVLATPPARDVKRNTLSVKLRALRKSAPCYRLLDISNFKDRVKREK